MKNIFTAVLFILLGGAVLAQMPGSVYKVESIPGEVTKRVNLWGYVNKPGCYEVPVETNLIQLITYAGGPKDYADLDDIKLYRIDQNGMRQLIEVSLDDISETDKYKLDTYDDDTIIVDYSAVVTWREVFGLISAPLAVVASLVLIIDRLSN